MIDYLYTNQNADETFGTIPEETFYSLEIIDYYNAYELQDLFGIKYKVDIASLKDNLVEDISLMVNNEEIELYRLYYLLNSLNTLESLDSSLDSNLRTKIYRYINETSQPGGGYGYTNTTLYANMISTYFVFNIHSLINEVVLNESNHINWILSCNNSDGGYGGNQSLSSTLLTTYCAVSLLSDLGITLANPSGTINYFDSLYVDDNNDVLNYGGYKPDEISENALLSSSYYCIDALNRISPSSLHNQASLNWLLDHQNLDGGFSDFIEGSSQRTSSIIGTYHTFKSLDILSGLNLLNEEIFMVEFSYLILIIILASIGILAVIIFIIWRRRRI
jgi:prenyltransferase beta subunit